MTDEEKVLKRLKTTLDVLTGKNVITNLDFQIRNMVEDCIRVIEKQQAEIEKKDKIVKSIISRLNNDINNIAETKAKKREHYLDDYTRCRLKAYKTKTREIKEYIEKQYFVVEKENKYENN